LGYAAVEIAYRVYQYSTIAGVLAEGVKAQLRDDLAFPVEWRTNSHGLVARSEFSIGKPAGVFLSGPVGEALG
jgi:hypothetical protein